MLPAVAKRVVARVLHARGPLLSRPGHEAAEGLVGQELFRRREVLGERRGVVRAVHRAVAGPADGDGAVQHGVGVALFSVALVCAPVLDEVRVWLGGRCCLVRELWSGFAIGMSRLLKLANPLLLAPSLLPLSFHHRC